MQIAEIVAHVAKETVDGTATVNPFRGCPNSRPTNIMRWWRKKHGTLWTTAEAKKVGERAAKILSDCQDRLNERVGRIHVIEWLERLVRDPFAFLMADDDHILEMALNSLEIDFGLRPAPEKPVAAAAATSSVQPAPTTPKPAPPVPSTAPNATSAAPDRIQRAANSAEIATLRKELAAKDKEIWAARDKLDQLATCLVEKPPPKAEDRPVKEHRYWPLPETIEYRPKKAEQRQAARQIVDPAADDPAFALRKEEFEQWLVRRREALEAKYAAREKELNDTFELRIKARVKKAVDTRMAKEKLYSSPLTEAQLKTLLIVLHPDTRDKATMAQKDSAARILVHTRSRLVFKDRDKGSTYIPSDPAPEPPQEGSPSTGALPDAV